MCVVGGGDVCVMVHGVGEKGGGGGGLMCDDEISDIIDVYCRREIWH